MVEATPDPLRRPPAARRDVPPGAAAVQVKPGAGVHARRVIFIDLARALAVVFMLYGHAVDALLAPAFRHGVAYDAWQFQRGLTSCLFLLLSGFAFSIATVRHWAAQTVFSPAVAKRARRFGLFILMGYLLHMPLAPISRLLGASVAEWRALFAVDVLHVIGVSFIGVQALVMVTRSPRVFTVVSLALAVAAVALTPWSWGIDWVSRIPLPAASYLTPATGSLFPVLPWSAFILLGAALGQIYARYGAVNLGRYANLVLIGPGAALMLLSLGLTAQQRWLFGTNPYTFVPGDLAMRAGVCLVGLGGLAHVSRRMTRLPHLFGAVAQESLVVYVVHLCIVYGSVWNPGLAHVWARQLGPGVLVPIVVGLIGAMGWLAWRWNAWRHTRPVVLRRIAIGTALLMAFRMAG